MLLLLYDTKLSDCVVKTRAVANGRRSVSCFSHREKVAIMRNVVKDAGGGDGSLDRVAGLLCFARRPWQIVHII